MSEEKIVELHSVENGNEGVSSGPDDLREGMSRGAEGSDSRQEKPAEVKSENEALYQKILSSVSTAPTHDDDIKDDAQKVSLQLDADSKVSQLTDLALNKGVVHAIKVAKHLNDFYVLDRMHDDLANRLYESLKQKGLIEEK